MDDSDEFHPLPRRITPETFYSGWHFSRPNYTRTALVDVVDRRGNRPVRSPKRASEAMIQETEERLGVRLPATLRAIYLVQDGGSLPTYFVPKHKDATNTYDDWITAFATDYDDLRPLSGLETLHDAYMMHFDPEYDDPKLQEDWITGNEDLVVLTIRTGYGTALDYRSGPEPGVLLFDHNESEPELKSFESFDMFLRACREIDDGPRPEDEGDEYLERAFGTPPSGMDTNRFWNVGNAGPGVTEEGWRRHGERLGVALPGALFPFYQAANGGTSVFTTAIASDGEPHAPAADVFPSGPYIEKGAFLKVEHWVSLATLSDRLDFVDKRPPWRTLYDDPEKLIVISAAFDSAILLDYRVNPDAPGVLAISDLDEPNTSRRFPGVDTFLSRLRRFGVPRRIEGSTIGDDRISSRLSDPESFWQPGRESKPMDETVLRRSMETWGVTDYGLLPQAITDIYAIQNGGPVRFRFAPPQRVNAHGHTNSHVASVEWTDVFPDGLLPIEEWRPLENWRAEHGLAESQSLLDFMGRITSLGEPDEKDNDVQVRLFVIGDHTSSPGRMVTVLDMSSSFSYRNRDLMTLAYDSERNVFEMVFGPIRIDNIYSGLHQTLRALKADL